MKTSDIVDAKLRDINVLLLIATNLKLDFNSVAKVQRIVHTTRASNNYLWLFKHKYYDMAPIIEQVMNMANI